MFAFLLHFLSWLPSRQSVKWVKKVMDPGIQGRGIQRMKLKKLHLCYN